MHSDSNLHPKVWNILHREQVVEEELSRLLPMSRTVCRILVNRGIQDLHSAHAFLEPDLSDLHDPSLMDGVDWGVARTRKAIEQGEKIMVHGDYDVDGITSTALLVRVLRLMGADVTAYIPHRLREGYDLGIAGVETACEQGVKLIITVDCGTSAVKGIGRARELGIDVIVTDHHEVGREIAPANVVINPKKPGCPYPFKDLAGVGVAFKFAEALVRESGYDVSVYRRRFADLAAVGTVADVVPLLGENRILVKTGLEELPRTGKKGLRALLEVSGLGNSKITSHNLAFGLGPRMNAAGRLDHASVALDMLLTTDEGEARRLAQQLDATNRERQAEQERISAEALAAITDMRLDETAKVFVLSSQGWHPGIVGIVASKITDRYCRPSILVAVDDTGIAGVGSARSIAAFDLFEALGQCGHFLDRFGGHKRAAGLSIQTDKLKDFTDAMNRIAGEVLTETDLMPQLDVDAELKLSSVTMDLAQELQYLEPYGFGNREPIFMSKNIPLIQKTRMGSTGSHLRLKLSGGSNSMVECVAFGWGDKDESLQLGSLFDVCYNIQVNQFAGNENVQAV
ncbi:MAG TPA: single-stranded-DNA-specific exonuclease RecJ, partial [Armatimonadota bacterium]